MNTTTETNSRLTPIQALNRCLEWFTLHDATAVLPGTKLAAVQELRNVIVAQELTQLPDGLLGEAVALLGEWVEELEENYYIDEKGELCTNNDGLKMLYNRCKNVISAYGE